MTITEFMEQMAARFPRYAGEISAWAGSYNRKLGHLSPDALRHCWESAVDSWTGAGYPKPEDFAKFAPPREVKIDGGRVEADCKRRYAELQGWISRTFEANTVEINQRAARHPNEPFNLYRACVTTKLEFWGRESDWYRKFQPAPHHHELSPTDFASIDALVTACEERKGRTVKQLIEEAA